MLRRIKVIMVTMSTLALSFVATSSLSSWDRCNSYRCSCSWDKKMSECGVDRCGILWELPATRCGKVCYDKCDNYCKKRQYFHCEETAKNEW